MSRLTDLIAQTKSKDLELGQELEREFKSLAGRLSFGLNFERHSTEGVELPGRPVRKGDKVRMLPPRGETILDVSRFDASPLIALVATKETNYGNETNGGIPGRCGADRVDERADTQTGGIGFGHWPVDAEQVGYGTSRR